MAPDGSDYPQKPDDISLELNDKKDGFKSIKGDGQQSVQGSYEGDMPEVDINNIGRADWQFDEENPKIVMNTKIINHNEQMVDPNSKTYRMGGKQSIEGIYKGDIPDVDVNNLSHADWKLTDEEEQPTRTSTREAIDHDEDVPPTQVSEGLEAETPQISAMDTSEFDALVAQYKKTPPVSRWTRITLGTGKKGIIGDESADAKSNGRLLRDFMGNDQKFFAYQVALGHISKEQAMAQLQPVQPVAPEPAPEEVADLTPDMRVDDAAKNDAVDAPVMQQETPTPVDLPNIDEAPEIAKPVEAYLGEEIATLNEQEQMLADGWENHSNSVNADEPKIEALSSNQTTKGPDYEALAEYAEEHNGLNGTDAVKAPLKEGDTIRFQRKDGGYDSFKVKVVDPLTGEPAHVRQVTDSPEPNNAEAPKAASSEHVALGKRPNVVAQREANIAARKKGEWQPKKHEQPAAKVADDGHIAFARRPEVEKARAANIQAGKKGPRIP